MEPTIRLIVDILLGGSLLASLGTILTLNNQIKKGKLENEEKAMQTFQTFIVDPLKKDINGLRKSVTRLEKAVGKIPECPHSAICPVRDELQGSERPNQ